MPPPLHPSRLLTQTRAVGDAVALLLWQVLVNRLPADRVLTAHLREHKEFGSRDRRLISALGYAVFRWWGWLRPLAPPPVLRQLGEACSFPFDPRRLQPLPAALTTGPGGTLRAEHWIPLLLATLEADGGDDDGIRSFWAGYCGVHRHVMQTPPGALSGKERLQRLFTAEGWKNHRTPDALEWGGLLPEWAAEGIACPRPLPELVGCLQRRPPLWLRVQRGDRAPLLSELAAAGLDPVPAEKLPLAVAVRNPHVNLYLVPAYREGRVEIQDLASQAIGAVCAPQPGQRWWDACAGAGGKSLLLAQLMQGKGVVTGSDVREFKLEDLRKRARRAGFSNITAKVWDGKPVAGRKATFDGVLVDAPCSCSGTWRRNPAARWSLTRAEAAEFPDLQLRILTAAAGAVKPGGVLVYATCSLFRAENEGVVAAFLAARPEFALEPVPHPLTGAPTDGQVMTWPWDGDCDAMFTARFRRLPAPKN